MLLLLQLTMPITVFHHSARIYCAGHLQRDQQVKVVPSSLSIIASLWLWAAQASWKMVAMGEKMHEITPTSS